MFCRNCKNEVMEQAAVCVACGCPPRAANKFCFSCGSETSPHATLCVKCGCALAPTAAAAPAYAPARAGTPGAKSRMVYVLLGALVGLVGFPGVHNLFAGRTGRGLTQLLVSVLTCWLLWIPMYIWTLVEVCSVTTDAAGRPME